MRLVGPALLVFTLLFVACRGEATSTSVPAMPTAAGLREAPLPDAFFLEVGAPKDEIVVQDSSVVIRGQTVTDAVVSVNGLPVELDANGNFAATVALEQGPNLIEVIASDFGGNQESRVISVIRTS